MLRLTFVTLWATAGVLAARPAEAQRHVPTAYLPLDHWATPAIEHLIARGVLDDPSPMIRPWRVGDVGEALRAALSSQLTDTDQKTVQLLMERLETTPGTDIVAIEADAGVWASSHARANSALRAAGDGHVFPRGGVTLALQGGRLALVTHPEWNYNIEHDPDYGGILAPAPVRFPESYIGLDTKYADVDFGRLSRNWGPYGFPGLLMSDVPYSYDHIYARLGTRTMFVETVIAQLTDMTNVNGENALRHFVAHRITARPWKFLDVAAWDAAILAGPNRHIEMWYLNPIQVFTQLRNERPSLASNALVGADIEVRLPSDWRIGAALMLDDAQIFNAPSKDDEPPSYSLMASVTKPVGPTNLFVGYTVVSNLAYRTHDPSEAVLIDALPGISSGTGLARNFSDYDQLTVRLGLMPAPLIVMTPELTLLRQGEGDLRLPFPDPADYAITPTLFDGTVERTVRAALEVHATLPRGITLSADAGWHHVTNAGHVPGQSEDRFVGTFAIRYAWGGHWRLR